MQYSGCSSEHSALECTRQGMRRTLCGAGVFHGRHQQLAVGPCLVAAPT